MNLQELQDKLIAWADAEGRKDLLLAARSAHFTRFGEPHEEDKSFEARMSALLDYTLYDFCPEGGSETVLERFMRETGKDLTTDALALYRELSHTVHSLFEVRRVRPGEIRLRDLFSRKDHGVTERRHLTGLAKGDLLEARLLRHQGLLYFSGAFLYQPPAARKAILAEVKRRRKAAGRGRSPDVQEFLAVLSRMAFKYERYRNVKVESIYDFSLTSTPTPRPQEGGPP